MSTRTVSKIYPPQSGFENAAPEPPLAARGDNRLVHPMCTGGRVRFPSRLQRVLRQGACSYYADAALRADGLSLSALSDDELMELLRP